MSYEIFSDGIDILLAEKQIKVDVEKFAPFEELTTLYAFSLT